jgi:hypothetical protein
MISIEDAARCANNEVRRWKDSLLTQGQGANGFDEKRREEILTSNGLGTSEFELLAFELGRKEQRNQDQAKLSALSAERDAYKKAKAENDERFQLEAGHERAENERLIRLLGLTVGALKGVQACPDSFNREGLAKVIAEAEALGLGGE